MEKAALSLIASTVSPIMSKLGNTLYSSYFGGDITSEELRNLQTVILPKIQAVIEAAETIRADKLKPWLMELKAAAYEAEDVLDQYQYEIIKNDVSPLPSSIKKLKGKAKMFFAPLPLKTALKASMDKLKRSADEADSLVPLLNLITKTAPQPDTMKHQQTTVSGLSTPVFGRDEERDHLINLLIKEGPHESTSTNRVIAYAIHGSIGGAGKTTLAQYVYNDKRVESHFSKRIWVHVSRNFDMRRVTREIIESIGPGGDECANIDNLDALQMKLEKMLKSMKFFIVLDDIWCEDRGEWDKLLVPLAKAWNIGCRILITTRMERVALTLGIKYENVVPLKELKTDVCWSILKHYALDDENKAIEDDKLADIKEKILEKLKKSPLAARLVGSLLRKKLGVDAWRNILKQDMMGDTLDYLRLSFQHLPPHLQRCFAFCSLFPKGYAFCSLLPEDNRYMVRLDLDRLVQLWVAQGFVEAPPNETGMTVLEKGKEYFDELLSYSFFQSHPTRKDAYVIHDLLHDVAERASKGYCFRVENDDDDPGRIPATVVHLSFVDTPMPDISKFVNLRTLMYLQTRSGRTLIFDGTEAVFEKLTRLRVLHVDISIKTARSLDCSIGQLQHLRYLHLPLCVNELPEPLGKLYHLQFLYLSESEVIRVPKSFSNLVNLQYLEPSGRICLRVPNIGKLTSLQTLDYFDCSKRSQQHGIGQLKNLQQLRGSLSIWSLEDVKNKAEAIEAKLNLKRHLERLRLNWGMDGIHENVLEGLDPNLRELEIAGSENVLEGLEPHPNLSELVINGYPGSKTPNWMLNIQDSLPNLQCLELSHCLNLMAIPHLPSRLKRLDVEDCPKLMQLSPFPHSLVTVRIDSCPGINTLLSFSINDGDKDERQQQQRRLKKLDVRDCPKLMQLSPFPHSLVTVIIRSCPGINTLLSSSINDGDKDERRPFSLDDLSIEACSGVDENTLNASMRNFDSLSRLRLHELPSITSLLLGPMLTALTELSIRSCVNLRSLEGIGTLPSLEALTVDECPKLILTPQHGEGAIALPSSLLSLEISGVDMSGVVVWERCLSGLTSLSSLQISNGSFSPSMHSLPDLHDLIALEWLTISDLPGLTCMGNLQALTSLKWLKVDGCPKLLTTTTGSLEGDKDSRLSCFNGELFIDDPLLLNVLFTEQCLHSLQGIKISRCKQETPFTAEQEALLQKLTSLQVLEFHACENLPSLPGNLEKLSSLKKLCISICPKIESLPNLEKLSSLKKLRISGCRKIESLPNLEKLSSLEALLIDCPKNESLPNLEKLSSLKKLYIYECRKIESLPNLPSSLQILDLWHCNPHLKDKYGEGGPLHHQINHIPDIRIVV